MKKIVLILIGIVLSSPIFAKDLKLENTKLSKCNDDPFVKYIKEPIQKLDANFDWNSKGCDIVASKTILSKEMGGKYEYDFGLQMFIYQDKQLKFICLPGWVCKSWAV